MGNPNHDQRGRFASKGGAPTFKTKGGGHRTEAQDRASLAKMRDATRALRSLGSGTKREARAVRNAAATVQRRWGAGDKTLDPKRYVKSASGRIFEKQYSEDRRTGGVIGYENVHRAARAQGFSAKGLSTARSASAGAYRKASRSERSFFNSRTVFSSKRGGSVDPDIPSGAYGLRGF